MKCYIECSIAVILVNYNGLNDTIECIESLNKSERKVSIIVVDNASEKCNAEIIEYKYSDVTVIRSKINLGFSGGNNLGIKYALDRGFDFIMLLNNDTVIDSKMITNLLLAVEKDTLVSPVMYYFDDKNSIWYGGGYINKFTGNAIHMNMNTSNEIKKDFYCSFATGCCWLMSRKLIEEIGLLSEEYFMYCEDVDYCIRLQNSGKKIKLVSNAKLWHKVSKSSGGNNSPFSIYYITRNRLYYLKRYRDYFTVFAYPFSVITRFVRIFQFLLKGEVAWKAFYKGIIDYYKGITGEVDEYI